MNERRTAASVIGKVSSRVAGRTSSGPATTVPEAAMRAVLAGVAAWEALDDLDARMLKVRDLPE